MKKKIAVISAVAASAALIFYSALSAPAKKMPCPKCFVMHPEILPLDAAGNRTYSGKNFSEERTCGECHNAQFINKHNSHYNDNVKIGCVACHVEGGVMPLGRGDINANGTINRDKIRIRVPSDDNCLRCHVAGGVKGSLVFIPEGYPGILSYVSGEKYFSLTWKTGEILSPENISGSHMNIKGRDKLQFPWDIHLQREVACVSCHFTANDPRREETRRSDQEYLANDPRKSYSIGKYLYIPDHKLVNADCRSCHTPEKKHDFLPYKKRHFAVLACQSCHVPRLYGPALKLADETVVTSAGRPRYEFRGIDRADAGNLNTAYNEGYVPYLLSHREEKPGSVAIAGLGEGISPVNIITRCRWVDADKKPVPFETVRLVYMDNGRYSTAVTGLFDKSGDGVLQDEELVLDTPEKIALISSRLASLGVKDPSVSVEPEAWRVNHGIGHEKSVSRDCYSCHSGSSRFGEGIVLASYSPGDGRIATDSIKGTNGLLFNGDGDVEKGDSGLLLVKNGSVTGRYIFGYSSVTWLNVLGFVIFMASVAGAAGHGALRFMAGRGHARRDVKTVTRKIYPLYERVWHWGMAISVIMLIVTGLEIHFAGSFDLFGFDNTVDVHNAFALIVAVNAGLSLFYHVATGEIRQYFSVKRGFRSDAIVQAVYYAYGIFKNSPHPFEKTPEKKLNPLQQITYVVLLNILFPVQIVTGIMMWMVSLSPSFSSAVGGLTVIAPVHNFFAWLFISFLAVHLYLITTGHTILGNLKAMITGHEEVGEHGTDGDVSADYSGIRFRDIIDNIKKIAGGGRA